MDFVDFWILYVPQKEGQVDSPSPRVTIHSGNIEPYIAEVGCYGAMVVEKSKKATKSQKGAVKRAGF